MVNEAFFVINLEIPQHLMPWCWNLLMHEAHIFSRISDDKGSSIDEKLWQLLDV